MKIISFPLLAAALGLAACSGGVPKVRVPVLSSSTPTGSVDRAAALLDAGDEGAAKKEVRAVLKRIPGDPRAQLLKDSIEKDPVELLGPQSFAYTVKPGETMTDLAGRFLGNRLKSYQLARYNNIETPAALAAGTVLRIPGEAPRAAPSPTPRSEPKSAKPAPAKPDPAAPKPATPRPAANPAAAAKARAAGLAALNQGKVAQAIALLRRARALDPSSPVIQRDLARAERIAAAVRAKR